MCGNARVQASGDEKRPGDSNESLQQHVQKAVNVEMVFTNSSRYDSKSIRLQVGKAIQEFEGHIRTLELHTGDRIGKTIPPDHPVIHWNVECAAEVINRFRVTNGKMTPRESIRG